jgi:hypothetical protein
MKYVLAYFGLMASAVFILTITFSLLRGSPTTKPPESPAARPSIYITRMDHAVTIERKPLWILEYTVDGVLQAPAFTSQEAMTRYVEYLETIGEMYRGEEE